MRSTLLTIFLLLAMSISAFSQALIGYTMSQVREKYNDAEWTYGKWGTNNELQSMSFENESIGVIYYFNEDFKSIITAIVPKSQGTLQGIIENYNKRYVIIDETHWKFYTNGSVLRCSLETTDSGLYFFSWTD